MLNQFFRKLRFEWFSDHIIKTLPMFLTLNIVALVVWRLDISHLAMPLVLGVIAGGLVDLDNSLTGRLKNLLLSLITFALSSLGASVALQFGGLFLPLAMASTFVLVMLGAIGQRYSTIAFGTLVVGVYTALTYSPDSDWLHNLLMILTGATAYGVVAMVVHLLFPNRIVQENLAKSFEALHAYLLAKSAYFDPDDDNLATKQLALAQANAQVMQAFDQTRVSLFYRLQGHNRQARTQRMLRFYFTAQDILERASSSHYQYHELFQQLSNSDLMFRFQRVLELQASACLKIAYALRQGEHYQHSERGEKAMQGLLNSLNYHKERGLKSAYRWLSIAENLRNIEGQLSQLEQASEQVELAHLQAVEIRKSFAKSHRLTAENVSGFRNMKQAILTHLTLSSQLFRHAIRLSLVVGVCSLLVPLFGLDAKGYWILLTAVFVCQPNYSATKKRLIERVIGTILGVLVGMILREYYLTSSLEGQLGLIVLTGSLYTFFRFRHYGFSTFFITLLVLISLDIIGIGANAGVLPRILDTLVGTGLAWFAVSFIYPDWKYLNLHRNLKQALQSCSTYLRHILAQLQFGYNDQLAYRIARREVHLHLSALSSAVANMHSEPKKYAKALETAPNLLGIAYTLLGYISALGAYRVESKALNHHVDFSAMFFRQGKQAVDILDHIANGKASSLDTPNLLAELIQNLTAFEQHNPNASRLELTLVQQLRMIVQLLPQLESFSQTELQAKPQIKAT